MEPFEKKPSYFDEIPITRDGMEDYLKRLKLAIKPVKSQYNRLMQLIEETNTRLKNFHK